MYSVMMYQSIRRGISCTAVIFGIDGNIQHTRYFEDGNWDTLTNIMLDWTRGKSESVRCPSVFYTGEIV